MRVAVYIDWQNVYNAARRAFGLTDLPTEEGQVSPLRVAHILASGNGRGAEGELVRVEVHRGLPNPSKDPIGYGANRRQSAAWMREDEELVIPGFDRCGTRAATPKIHLRRKESTFSWRSLLWSTRSASRRYATWRSFSPMTPTSSPRFKESAVSADLNVSRLLRG